MSTLPDDAGGDAPPADEAREDFSERVDCKPAPDSTTAASEAPSAAHVRGPWQSIVSRYAHRSSRAHAPLPLLRRAHRDPIPAVHAIPADEPQSPFSMPLARWANAGWRVKDRLQHHHLGLIAAGIAFYGLLGLAPALASAVALYGLAADPADVTEIARSLRGVMPGGAIDMVVGQLDGITSGSEGALSFGALFGLLLSFWSANRATKAIFTGLNVAHQERERRNFFMLNAASLAMTIVIMLAALIAIGAVTMLPSFVPDTWLGTLVVHGVRWLALGLGMLALIGALHRWGASRATPRWTWVSVGSLAATTTWLITSAGFSLYVERFGNYNETFGALGGVAITMTWMWLSVYLILTGALVNAELEHETLQDSTTGPPRPIGERGAFVADDVPESVRGGPERDAVRR
jgi:membrane protein